MARPDGQLTPAVLYAAKSTEDLHGSIPTQLEDARALAEREGHTVKRECRDESASAYKGDRGPGLSEALTTAETLAQEHGSAALVVQHSDRLARGDGRQAKHLVEYALWALKHDIKVLSVQDPQTFSDVLNAALMGQRNHDDSARKGMATAVGHRRRWESGKRLGGKIRDGYKLVPVLDANGEAIVGKDGRAERTIAFDAEREPVWNRIFDLIESGHTCGEVRATLNAEGIHRKLGGPWRTRDIRRGVLDDFYAGRAHGYGDTNEGDHEPLIDPVRWERIAAMVRTDQRASKGGRPALAEGADYLLRGVATCGRCGSSLRTRKLAAGRMYICAAVRESRGMCDAGYIPAEAAEHGVLDHLDSFIANVRGWLEQRTAQSTADRDRLAELVDGQLAELRTLTRRAERAHQMVDRLLDDEDDDAAAAAMRKAAAVEAERDHLAETIAQAEQHVADWPVPDVDEALDVYQELRDAVSGRVSGSHGIRELRATLRAVLAHAALDLRDGVLHGSFRLRATDAVLEGRLPDTLEIEDGQRVFGTWLNGDGRVRLELGLDPALAADFERAAKDRGLDVGEALLEALETHVESHEPREEPNTTC